MRLYTEVQPGGDVIPTDVFNAKHQLNEHVRLMPKRTKAAKAWLLSRTTVFRAMVKRLERERRIKQGKMVAVERIDDWLQLQ